MELLVACVIAYYLVRHGPELIAEALAEAEFARRGMLSPAAAARLQRLRDAGIDPAAGGAARQFFGNAWRDAWLDLDEQRRRRRAERQVSGGDSRGWADRLDAAVTAMAARWRARISDGATPIASAPADNLRGDAAPAPSSPADPGGDFDDWTPDPSPQPDRGSAPQDNSEPAPAPTADVPPPVKVPSAQGAPVTRRPLTPGSTAPPATEGTPTMTGTSVVHVTGVASAAAEARAIQRQLAAVTAAYRAELAKIRNRAIALGATTVGEIQQAMSSRTVEALMVACEVIADAEANANATAEEAGPAMGRVARAFERIV